MRARGSGKWQCEKAGSFDIDKVIARRPAASSSKKRPRVHVKVHENHHLWSKLRIGRGGATANTKVIYEMPA